MDFTSKKTDPVKLKTDALIVPIYENDDSPSALVASLDDASAKLITNTLAMKDISGKSGELQTVPVPAGTIAAKRLVLMGLGEKGKTKLLDLRKTVLATIKSLKGTAAKDVALLVEPLDIPERDATWLAQQLVELAGQATYSFQAYKSKSKPVSLKKLTLIANGSSQQKQLAAGITTGQAIVSGMDYCKDLGNTPPNVCNPTYLANQAKKLAKTYAPINVTVIDEKEMKSLGMGAFLAVSAGSDTPGKLIIMEYNGGAKSEAPHVIVGKGITFDTGGISLKPAPDMDAMKWDMCGAASVFGAMKAIAEIGPAMNVIGVVAAAENMPSGKATRPGDIVTTMSGQTVEILNTDAEGRLVLCDALTYVERYKPASVLDIATLTGAVIVALGPFASGLMSNDEAIVADLEAAADYTQDKVWRLPLWDEYQSLLDSPFADIGNIGNAGPKAGSITAGCYLSRFTKNYPWAHLDVAGSAFSGGANKGATGRPVPLLTQYLLNKLNKA